MELKWSLFTREIRPHPLLRVRLQQKINKIEQHLAKQPPGVARLRVSLEKHEKKKWFRAALMLQSSSGVLRVEKFGNDPMVAFDQAMRSLAREVSKSKVAVGPSEELSEVASSPTLRPTMAMASSVSIAP